MRVEYIYLSSSEVAEASGESIAVIPVGSVEQHCMGPLGTDGLIAERLSMEACRRAARYGVKCIVLPAIYYGFSPEWSRSPGTISISMETFTRLIREVLDRLYDNGFRKFMIVNAHGGNSGVLEAVAREWTSSKSNVVITLAEYWRLLGIKLGHASSVEREVGRLLGLNMDFGECRDASDIIDHTIIKPPRRDIGSVESGGVVGVDVIEEVARLMARIYRMSNV